MRILYLCHRIPYPPNKGDKIRAYHYIRHLSRRHAIHLACVTDREEDVRYQEELGEYCEMVSVVYCGRLLRRLKQLTALLSGEALSIASFQSRKLKYEVDQCLGSQAIDVIVAQSAAMGQYVRNITTVPRVMDFVDVDSEKWQAMAGMCRFPWSTIYRREALRTARHEAELAILCDRSIVVSEREAQLLEKRLNGRKIDVVRNGVDIDYYNPASCSGDQSKHPTLVFTGMMDYFPNVDAVVYFCEEFLPRLRESVPGVRLLIVGRNPTREVRELARAEDVTVTGEVPDVRPYLRQAWVSVAPFRIARGVQNKVLEAMAMGLPVVGTSLAFQGVRAGEESGIHAAESPGAIVASASGLLLNNQLREDAAKRARAFVVKNFAWQEHAAQLESILKEVVRKPVALNSLPGESSDPRE